MANIYIPKVKSKYTQYQDSIHIYAIKIFLNFSHILVKINSIIKNKHSIETYSTTKLHTHTQTYAHGFRKKRIKVWKMYSEKVSQTFQKRSLMKEMSKFTDIFDEN